MSEKVNEVVGTITTLKSENQQLKKELNEVIKKLDDITSVNTGSEFKLLPVSGGKENR
jgi:hypothetical protein